VHRTLRVRVRVSKISSVALQIRRGDDTIVSRDVTLRRGTHTFRLKPSRRGELEVGVSARDPAGNAATVRRTVAISGNARSARGNGRERVHGGVELHPGDGSSRQRHALRGPDAPVDWADPVTAATSRYRHDA
jgi:hypothetical protein